MREAVVDERVLVAREFILEGITVLEYASLFAAIYGVRRGEEAILRVAKLEARASQLVARLSGGEVDLAAVTNGALALACSDAFFGPMNTSSRRGAR